MSKIHVQLLSDLFTYNPIHLTHLLTGIQCYLALAQWDCMAHAVTTAGIVQVGHLLCVEPEISGENSTM